jgi:signal peptidase II
MAHDPAEASRTRAPVARWLALALVVVALDQASKWAILGSLEYGERLILVPGWFDLTLVYNTGAAFSFLAGAAGWQRWFFAGLAIVASAVIVFLLRRHGGQALFATALALIMGGAVGNLVDRLVHAKVVDFLLFYRGDWYFPAFNLADSAITVGATLLVVDELLRMRRERRAATGG